jgi:hypothetical protein
MDKRVIRAAAILPHPAVAAFLVVDSALTGAQLALDLLVRQLFVELGFLNELCVAFGRR